MDFRTKLKPFSLPFQIELKDSLFFMGSCFADSMSQKFKDSKFEVTSNPFGTLYNPISIARAILDIVEKANYPKDSQIENHGVHYSWHHHGSVASVSSEELSEKTASINRENYSKIKNCVYLFITLGSAWAYRFKKTKHLVANCHKIPSQEFDKEFCVLDENIDELERAIRALKRINRKVEIVFTISPVRHIRDGLIENNRSKAALIQTVHALCEKYECCHYLPVYEWIIDDLRDYRFFEKDLVHPNKQAQDYVWENMSELLFSEKTKKNLKSINNFLNGVSHRPFNPETEAHISFLEKLLLKGKTLENELGLNLNSELKQVEQNIKKHR